MMIKFFPLQWKILLWEIIWIFLIMKALLRGSSSLKKFLTEEVPNWGSFSLRKFLTDEVPHWTSSSPRKFYENNAI